MSKLQNLSWENLRGNSMKTYFKKTTQTTKKLQHHATVAGVGKLPAICSAAVGSSVVDKFNIDFQKHPNLCFPTSCGYSNRQNAFPFRRASVKLCSNLEVTSLTSLKGPGGVEQANLTKFTWKISLVQSGSICSIYFNRYFPVNYKCKDLHHTNTATATTTTVLPGKLCPNCTPDDVQEARSLSVKSDTVASEQRASISCHQFLLHDQSPNLTKDL